jgi:hypothetical protein
MPAPRLRPSAGLARLRRPIVIAAGATSNSDDAQQPLDFAKVFAQF